jgi:hypothetical protein
MILLFVLGRGAPGGYRPGRVGQMVEPLKVNLGFGDLRKAVKTQSRWAHCSPEE